VVNYLSTIVFVALMLPGLAVAAALGGPRALVVVVLWALVAGYAASAVRLAAEWERGVVFRLGKLSSVKGPGVYLVIPLIDQVRVIETRVQTLTIARQQVITRDNVPVSIDGVLFFRVDDAAQAVVKVQDFRFAISQYARTSLRDVIGQMTLDELLSEREQIEAAIGSHVEKDTSAWGLHVVAIRMEDIDMPEELKKMMSRQASAEREKRANITKAEGDRDAATNLAAAADGLGPTASNTVVLAIPVEVMSVLSETTSFLKERKIA
jgi:regulator of protease activity HflC (stomatin/prohibitin superfamily)